ncbi:formate dehydrogenase accessory sulfurtransferase FdhD [Acidithiobacillus sp. M4-SHS-6]|uniref:formate dehydrogenase accessory sulfurtransferase FdhD n=1 Tax=Acidithiobacillus sp. M4-SHS-6 TaxID=3383024 RepID=UPI0039BE9105
MVTVSAQPWADDHCAEVREEIVVEELPISIVINGVSYAVMLATPLDLEDFVTGFLWTETIIQKTEEILALEISDTTEGWAIFVQVDEAAAKRAVALRRVLPGGSSCGLCGIPDFAGLQPFPPLPAGTVPVKAAEIFATFSEMKCQQFLNDQNGNTHAAALRFRDGCVLVREDIGRHNAVDKALGAALRAGREPEQAPLLAVSSRLSFEILRKAISWRVPLVAAISGVSSLAIEVARRNNVIIIGYARDSRYTVYGTAEGSQPYCPVPRGGDPDMGRREIAG